MTATPGSFDRSGKERTYRRVRKIMKRKDLESTCFAEEYCEGARRTGWLRVADGAGIENQDL